MPVSSARTLIIFNSAAQLDALMCEKQVAFSDSDVLLLDCGHNLDESAVRWLAEQFGTTFRLNASAPTNPGDSAEIDYDEWARLSIQYAHTVFWPLA